MVEAIRCVTCFLLASLKQNGNFYGNTMLYKQYNLRAKVDIELVRNLTVGANINAIFKDGDYPGGGNNGVT